MKIETGVMVMKNGRAWGETYTDGQSTAYGWMDPESAPIHDPRYCRKPTDVTYNGSHYTEELSAATLVQVERRTTVTILDDTRPAPREGEGKTEQERKE